MPAHPRSRGENNAQSVAAETGKGSSPLTRGKHLLWRLVSNRQRLIPAHAGKTKNGVSAPGLNVAHPRSRGENETAEGDLTPSAGSSPLTRGKLNSRSPMRRVSGLIPAHAGKTRRGRPLQ